MADDLLDFVGDPEVTGKEQGIDLLNGHVTLPLIYSLRRVSEKSAREIVTSLKDDDGEVVFHRVYNFINECGGLDYAANRATELSEQALDSISSVGNSTYYDALTNMVRYTVKRAS